MTKILANISEQEIKGYAFIIFDVIKGWKVQIVPTSKKDEKKAYAMTQLIAILRAENVISLLKTIRKDKKPLKHGKKNNLVKKNTRI